MLSAYGACQGAGSYNAGADLNGDGCVDLADLAVILSAFGTTCTG